MLVLMIINIFTKKMKIRAGAWSRDTLCGSINYPVESGKNYMSLISWCFTNLNFGLKTPVTFLTQQEFESTYRGDSLSFWLNKNPGIQFSFIDSYMNKKCVCRANSKSCPVYGGRYNDPFAPSGTTDVLNICDDYNANRINKNCQHYMCAGQRRNFSLNKLSFTDQSPLFPSLQQF